MTMDARKQRVLQAIVALYGLEGEPVGSSVLANYFDMAVSSATLRNEMAALTKLGLLEQPHTSAGRVPSAKGYRYYLDNLLTDDQPLDRVTRAQMCIRDRPRVHAPGGQVVPHRRFRRGGLRHGRGRRRAPCIRPDLRQRQIFLYIKAAALPGGKVAPVSYTHLCRRQAMRPRRPFRQRPSRRCCPAGI